MRLFPFPPQGRRIGPQGWGVKTFMLTVYQLKRGILRRLLSLLRGVANREYLHKVLTDKPSKRRLQKNISASNRATCSKTR